MALTRPKTITGLADAYTNCKLGTTFVVTPISLMGIVIDVLSPTRTSSGGMAVSLSTFHLFSLTTSLEWVVTFTIQDSDMMKIPVTPKGLKARFFVKTEEELPPIPSVCDIVLIRNCKVAILVHAATIIFNIVCRSHPIEMCQR
jgi:protection-of-telomeres protein 1